MDPATLPPPVRFVPLPAVCLPPDPPDYLRPVGQAVAVLPLSDRAVLLIAVGAGPDACGV
jgi:hypothetical protein